MFKKLVATFICSSVGSTYIVSGSSLPKGISSFPNLINERRKKNAVIYLSDFKGGLDYPAIWHEPEELVGKTLIAITNLPPRAMMGIESCGMLLSAVNNLKDSEDEELRLLMVDNHIPAGAKLY